MQLLDDTIDLSDYMTATDAHYRLRKATEYADDVVAYFHAKNPHHGAVLPWQKTEKVLAFRAGEVSLWGGMNGHGKSLVLGQACVGFARQKQRTVIASMEMRPTVTLARMVRQEYGRLPTEDAIRQFHAWTDGLIWLYDQVGAVQSDKMLAVMRYAADKVGANHFIIDSLMKCGIPEDDYNAQKHFLDAICSVGRDSGMHIHLVAHSRKARDELSPPGKMDVKGSGSITDQVDNVITVWRNKGKEQAAEKGNYSSDPDCLLICDKQRNGEWEGRIGLWLDKDRLAFEESAINGF